jgi:hypothetical protein
MCTSAKSSRSFASTDARGHCRFRARAMCWLYAVRVAKTARETAQCAAQVGG